MKLTVRYDDEDQFNLALGAAASSRAVVLEKWQAAIGDAEKAFYEMRLEQFDKLIAKYEANKIADKSQDAEPEDEEEEA